MRRAVAAAGLTLALALAGCGQGGGAATRAAAPATLAVQRAELAPGVIRLLVHNGTRTPAQLAQVAIDRGFVGFTGPPSIAPHATAALTVRYPWNLGEGYDVKVIAADGATLAYRIDARTS